MPQKPGVFSTSNVAGTFKNRPRPETHPPIAPVVRGRVAEVPAGLVLPEGTVLVEPIKRYEPEDGVPDGVSGRTFYERLRIEPGSLTVHLDENGNRYADPERREPTGQTLVWLRSGTG